MKNISSYISKKDIDASLKKDYMISLSNGEFVKLVNKLEASEEVLIKNNSKLNYTLEEIKNCKNCKGLEYCKNKINGYVYYPYSENNNLVFDYTPCKHKKAKEKNISKARYFEVPEVLKEAKLSEIYPEKERMPIVKYIKEFLNNFEKGKYMKGIYLYGSFGSGKSYILSALINELSKKDNVCTLIYYPNLLKTLKASFGSDDFDLKLDEIMKSDVLLLDDIGAENNTSWSRDEILGPILQYRMDNKLATFFTSNLKIEELEIHLKSTNNSVDSVKARRIIERVKELSVEMPLISENKRK